MRRTLIILLAAAIQVACGKQYNPDYKTLYHNGLEQMASGDISSAIYSFHHALELTPDNDYKYKGLIYSNLADAFNYSNSNKEELEFQQAAREAFRLYGDAYYNRVSTYRLALSYQNNQEYLTADSLYQSVCPTDSIKDNEDVIFLLARADNIIRSSGLLDASCAISIYQKVIASNEVLSIDEYYRYAYALLLASKVQEANAILDNLEGISPDNSSLWWVYKIKSLQGKNAEALSLLEEITAKQDSIVRYQLSSSVYKAQDEHLKVDAELAKLKANSLSKRIIIILLTSVILLGIGLFILKKNRSMLDASKESQSKTDALYTNLYRSLFKDKASFPEYITNQNLLEQRINNDFNGIIDKLKKDFPNMTPEDIRFACYTLLNLDSSAIALLTNTSKGNVRVKKHRLRERILGANTIEKTLYSTYFGVK
ncbi:MAG: hypothetical protein J6X63_05260 [Bacteroidales bacterium]|nr:hypothetical protein [Bacteroidales bacterium]